MDSAAIGNAAPTWPLDGNTVYRLEIDAHASFSGSNEPTEVLVRSSRFLEHQMSPIRMRRRKPGLNAVQYRRSRAYPLER